MSASITPERPPAPAYGPELAELIADASQRAGGPAGRLPTERQLASNLGVTRTMVRNALALLEAEGRVSREVGRGTFLIAARERPAAGDQLEASDLSPADVMAARRLFEPQVMRLVVAQATARDFDKLQRCLEAGEKVKTFDEYDVADFALHHTIIEAAHNPLLLEMYAVLERARQGKMWGNMKRRGDSRERRAASIEDHRRLVQAICARELEDAVAAMEYHLARVEYHLLGFEPAEGDRRS